MAETVRVERRLQSHHKTLIAIGAFLAVGWGAGTWHLNNQLNERVRQGRENRMLIDSALNNQDVIRDDLKDLKRTLEGFICDYYNVTHVRCLVFLRGLMDGNGTGTPPGQSQRR